jgi:hypothetical protein
LFAAAGVAWALLMPLTSKDVSGEEANEMQRFSIARYGAAKARYEARPAPGQMMAWLQEGLAKAGEASIKSLGIVETTGEPIFVVGPLYDSGVQGFSLDDVLRRKVEGGYFYSTFRVAVFQFAEQFLGAYQADYNMIKDALTSERTDEFFYRDVVAVRVSSESSNYTLKTGERLEHAKTFSLAVSSGDKINVVINDPCLSATSELESLGNDAVANVRSMLRQYKEVPATA